MFLYYIFAGLQFLIFPIFIIGLIVYFVRRWGRKKASVTEDDSWYRRFSREDSMSQSLLLLSVLFLWITLLAFNRDLGDAFSWRTIALIISLVSILGAYSLKAVYLLAPGLIGIMGWWGVQAFRWLSVIKSLSLKNINSAAIFSGLSLIALLFFVLGHLHESESRYRRFTMIYLILGIFWVSGALFFLSTRLGLVALEAMTKGSSLAGSWPVVFSLFLFSLALIGGIIYGSRKKLIYYPEALVVFVLGLVFLIITFLPEQNLFIGAKSGFSLTGGNLSHQGVLWAIIFNLLVFLELLGLIFSGYVRREGWLINLGALFLFLLIIVKYFDWFFTFLDKSVFFISAGILLFVVGWFMERGRRYMITSIKPEEERMGIIKKQ